MNYLLTRAWSFVRGAVRGVLPLYILIRVRGPFEYTSGNAQTIVLRPRGTCAWYRIPRNDGFKEDYEYTLNPVTEISLLPFFKTRPGVFVDIGAFIGKYTIPLAQGNATRVIAVEPNPVSRCILAEAVELNQIHNKVTIIDRPIGKRDEIVRLVLLGGVARTEKAKRGVRSITFHELLAITHVSYADISLIKIDVEGGEEIILKQLVANAHRFKSIRIICEILETNRQTYWLQKFRAKGFRASMVDNQNLIAER
jgi:FkbM family methyltransferase